MFNGLGQCVGAVVGGLLYDGVGPVVMFRVYACVIALAYLVFLVAARKHKIVVGTDAAQAGSGGADEAAAVMMTMSESGSGSGASVGGIGGV